VLVGGRGSRLGALTAETPKPFLPCGDRPFLAWVMREFIRFGVEEFVLLAGYRAEHITAAAPKLAALLPRPVRILVSEEPEPAGTGGALFHARALLDQRFLLCNGDSLFDTNMTPLVTADAQSLMLLRRVDDASRYGVVSLAGGRVSGFDAVSTRSSPGIINTGVYLLDRSLLDECTPSCSLEADILPRIAGSVSRS
jgi:D-glycero-D-manno-heptose 1,7-bisphosphate phosphatase